MSEAQKKKAAPPVHPLYKEMIIAAIVYLKDRKGASRQAILKHIKANYEVGENARKLVNTGLRRGIENGTLETGKGGSTGRFKLSEATKTAKKPAKKPVAKKPAAKTTKTKKPAAKTTKKPSKPTPKKLSKSPKKAKSPAKPKTKKPAGKVATKKAGAKKGTPKKGAKKPAAKKATKTKK